MGTKGFFQFEIIINVLASPSDSFEYLCYRSTPIRNILFFSVRGPSLYVKICRLRTTDSDGPRAERVIVKKKLSTHSKDNSQSVKMIVYI